MANNGLTSGHRHPSRSVAHEESQVAQRMVPVLALMVSGEFGEQHAALLDALKEVRRTVSEQIRPWLALERGEKSLPSTSSACGGSRGLCFGPYDGVFCDDFAG